MKNITRKLMVILAIVMISCTSCSKENDSAEEIPSKMTQESTDAVSSEDKKEIINIDDVLMMKETELLNKFGEAKTKETQRDPEGEFDTYSCDYGDFECTLFKWDEEDEEPWVESFKIKDDADAIYEVHGLRLGMTVEEMDENLSDKLHLYEEFMQTDTEKMYQWEEYWAFLNVIIENGAVKELRYMSPAM